MKEKLGKIEVEAKKSKPSKRQRPPGRPPAGRQTQLSRQDVIDHALALARETALHEITISQIARQLDVTPGLIHYLIGDRNGVITGVMNAFYRKLCSDWPRPEGRWRDHMTAMAHHLHRYYVTYRGVMLYTAAHNRYRIVQDVEDGEVDYGLVFLDLLFQGTMTMGVDPATTVLFCETFIDFVSGQARAAIGSRLPREHETYLRGVFEHLDPANYPGIAFAGDELFRPNSQELYERSLDILMDAFEQRRARLI